MQIPVNNITFAPNVKQFETLLIPVIITQVIIPFLPVIFKDYLKKLNNFTQRS
jgi:hypothetical protein